MNAIANVNFFTDNPINSLTIADIAKIFAGKTSNWYQNSDFNGQITLNVTVGLSYGLSFNFINSLPLHLVTRKYILKCPTIPSPQTGLTIGKFNINTISRNI